MAIESARIELGTSPPIFFTSADNLVRLRIFYYNCGYFLIGEDSFMPDAM